MSLKTKYLKGKDYFRRHPHMIKTPLWERFKTEVLEPYHDENMAKLTPEDLEVVNPKLKLFNGYLVDPGQSSSPLG